MKTCTKCCETKELDEFYRSKATDRKIEHRPHCKECMKAAQRARPVKRNRTAEQKAEYARRRGDRDCPYVPLSERRLLAAAKRAARLGNCQAHVNAWRHWCRSLHARPRSDQDRERERLRYHRDKARCAPKLKAYDLRRKRRQIDELQDNYIKKILCEYSGLRHRDIPKTLVDFKRATMKLTRLLTEKSL